MRESARQFFAAILLHILAAAPSRTFSIAPRVAEQFSEGDIGLLSLREIQLLPQTFKQVANRKMGWKIFDMSG